MRKSTIARFVAALLTAVAVAVVTSTPALAHVTAEVDGGTPGEYGLITFRVPTESDTANTTKVEVRVPDDVHLASVLVEPQPGWRADVTKQEVEPVSHHGVQTSEAVKSITWTATSGGIAPGEFGRFVLLAGPLPDAASVALPTVQTYSDGTEVAWTQQAVGDAEPERPAPEISLVAAAPEPRATTPSNEIAWTALGLAILAILLGGVAVLRVTRRAAKG